eukprot:2368720-Rhodomonas_salina.2
MYCLTHLLARLPAEQVTLTLSLAVPLCLCRCLCVLLCVRLCPCLCPVVPVPVPVPVSFSLARSLSTPPPPLRVFLRGAAALHEAYAYETEHRGKGEPFLSEVQEEDKEPEHGAGQSFLDFPVFLVSVSGFCLRGFYFACLSARCRWSVCRVAVLGAGVSVSRGGAAVFSGGGAWVSGLRSQSCTEPASRSRTDPGREHHR